MICNFYFYQNNESNRFKSTIANKTHNVSIRNVSNYLSSKKIYSNLNEIKIEIN